MLIPITGRGHTPKAFGHCMAPLNRKMPGHYYQTHAAAFSKSCMNGEPMNKN